MSMLPAGYTPATKRIQVEEKSNYVPVKKLEQTETVDKSAPPEPTVRTAFAARAIAAAIRE